MPPIAKAVWMAKRGLEILAFRVSDGVDYKIVMEHKELQQRWEMYRLRGKRTPGPYSKAFLNLLFDQLKVSPLHGTAQIVRTTRTERGKKIGALIHKVGKDGLLLQYGYIMKNIVGEHSILKIKGHIVALSYAANWRKD